MSSPLDYLVVDAILNYFKREDVKKLLRSLAEKGFTREQLRNLVMNLLVIEGLTDFREAKPLVEKRLEDIDQLMRNPSELLEEASLYYAISNLQRMGSIPQATIEKFCKGEIGIEQVIEACARQLVVRELTKRIANPQAVQQYLSKEEDPFSFLRDLIAVDVIYGCRAFTEEEVNELVRIALVEGKGVEKALETILMEEDAIPKQATKEERSMYKQLKEQEERMRRIKRQFVEYLRDRYER